MSVDSNSEPFAGELPDLAAIQAAARRIGDRLAPTPCVFAEDLSTSLGQPLWVKAENLQPTGSFKVRGALNWLRTASEEELAAGLVTVSAGNHALALAWAASQLKVPVTVVMPEGSSALKIQNTRQLGARVIVRGNIREAVAHCHELRVRDGLTLVHPYNDPRVMAGQGTVALELLEQIPDLERVIVPVGGGGLISGVGLALKALRPQIQLVGVEPEGAATLRNAWDKRDVNASLSSIDTIAVSLGPAVVGEYTYTASRRVVDTLVTVADEHIIGATLRLLSDARLYVETGAAVGLAALLAGIVPAATDSATALIITGGNLDLSQLQKLLAPASP